MATDDVIGGISTDNYSDVSDNSSDLDFSDFNMADTLFLHYLGTIVVPVLFSLIILIGTCGNILVVFVILSNPNMKNQTNILLVNLAVADILFLLTCVPFQTYKFAGTEFVFGDAACKVAQYSLYVCTYVTVYTLVAIAILRYVTVVKSHSTLRYRTVRNAIMTCVLIWVLILLFNIPTWFSHKLIVNQHNNISFSYCGVDSHAVQPLFLSFFIAGYIIPLLMVSGLYFLILLHLKRHQIPQQQTSKKDKTGKRQQRTTHAFKVIISVILVFAISWLPLHVHILISLYGKFPEGKVYSVLHVLWHCMAYGNSISNPFIYGFVSTEFRESFKKVFCACCCKTVRRSCANEKTDTTYVEQLSILKKENRESPPTAHEDKEMRPLNGECD